jgi:hypothetical protein
MATTGPASTWCVCANVKPEAYGNATSAGTRQFRAGALLWCLPPRWGDGYERITVIGYRRGSVRLVAMVMPSERLTNWRAKVAYNPKVLRLIAEHHSWTGWEQCDRMARAMAALHPATPDLRERAVVLNAALQLMTADPQGRALEQRAAVELAAWSVEQRAADVLPPPAVGVLADWLEERGSVLPLDLLVETIERRARVAAQ